MLLAVDIGNSAIKFGLFDGEELTRKFSIPTKRQSTSDEITVAVEAVKTGAIDAVMICSVVPDVDDSIANFVLEATGCEPVFVTNSFDFGLKISYEPLGSLGTDRLVNAFAAVEKYGAPCLVCSLGTATTIDVVTAEREFLGGVIAPGMDAMAEALHIKAPRLPHVEIDGRPGLLGNTTEDSIRSGIYNGYVAMVRGLIENITSEAGTATKVATGGNAAVVAEIVDIVEHDLVLEGLRILAGR